MPLPRYEPSGTVYILLWDARFPVGGSFRALCVISSENVLDHPYYLLAALHCVSSWNLLRPVKTADPSAFLIGSMIEHRPLAVDDLHDPNLQVYASHAGSVIMSS